LVSKTIVRRSRRFAQSGLLPLPKKGTGDDGHWRVVDPNRATLPRNFPEGDQDFSPRQGEASLSELRRRPGCQERRNIGRADRAPSA
jgi:hypothetical protein